ncbi:uncharacterized protein MELLADRAFT_90351 [Melampsora larici-populina 98AG31]|uniref:Uncharacterized protein n=1 Tax=Melampsora larici-populina (strain 98AG31 / pathotype 3-4-7) TaxID=747676 RepID=F4RWL8_MELLP|nr:uncharacterized protein MELLADRAFT_90351 [Melampsora larici-populina 98AG31]EGG03211.1 hypothetical protein MELLADRAFT_90351 [Melampsora larici-populina 98AG31]
MRLIKLDVKLQNTLFWDIKTRLTRSLTTIEWIDTNARVYSKDTIDLLYSTYDYEFRILPKICTISIKGISAGVLGMEFQD